MVKTEILIRGGFRWVSMFTLNSLRVGQYLQYLTNCMRVLLEKLTVTQLVKKFPTFYGTRMFITACIRIRRWSHSWARFIQFTFSYPTIHSNIILLPKPRPSKWSRPFRISGQNCVYPSHFSHACYMPHPSNIPLYDHPNNIWWSEQVMKFLTVQSSTASPHFLPLRSKYSPLHPVHKHPQSMFFRTESIKE
jgi:hypothetical protein